MLEITNGVSLIDVSPNLALNTRLQLTLTCITSSMVVLCKAVLMAEEHGHFFLISRT